MRNVAIILIIFAVLSSVWLALPETQTADQSATIETRFIGDFKAETLGRLRISRWNARALAAQTIEIEKRNEAWVLPQHYNYPADAGSLVGDLAGALLAIELARPIQMDRTAWSDYRLHDPLTDAYEDGLQYGRRVSLWLDTGVLAVDIVVGAEVDSDKKLRYIRFVKDGQVFIANFDQALPTRFSDWVETRLLPIDGADIRYVKSDQYRFDESQRKLQKGVHAEFARDHVDQLWRSPHASEGQVVNDTAVYRVLRAALEARLHGVKPLDLRNIKQAEVYGVFLNRGIGTAAGRNPLAGNEGLLTIGCKDGIYYNLYLGELAQDDSLDHVSLSGGFRYVMLACEYRLNDDESYNGSNAQQCMHQGKTRAQALNARFTQFVYVIEESDYKLLHPTLEDLFKVPDQAPQP